MDAELVYGRHAVEAIMRRDLPGVRELWVQEGGRRGGSGEQLAGLARSAGITVHRVPRRTLDAMLGGAKHQGLVARYRGNTTATVTSIGELLAAVSEQALLLVLDGVEDPHNLGACLRSVDAVGAHGIIVPRSRTCGLTAVVRKVACGAAETVPVLEVPNLARALRDLQESGVRVVGTAGDADSSVFEADMSGHVAVVMGSEGAGMRRLTREHCDLLVRIPMAGSVSSLNVSVAAAVCLFEVRRQRLLLGD